MDSIESERLRVFVQRLGQDITDVAALSRELDSFSHAVQAEDIGLSMQHRAIVDQWLLCLRQVCIALEEAEPDLSKLGKAWIHLAMATLHLYLPNVAIDPVVTQRTQESFQKLRTDRVNAQLEVMMEVEHNVTGNNTSPLISSIRHQLEQYTAQSPATVPVSLSRQPDLASLTQLYRELHSFTKQVLDPRKLEELVAAIQQGLDMQSEEREANLQSSIGSFSQRLSKVYPSFSDIVGPFQLVLDQIQLGFRTLLQGARFQGRDTKAEKHGKVLEALVAFPTSRATSHYGSLDLPVRLKTESRAGGLAAPLLLTSVAAVAVDVSHGVSLASVLRRISRTYDQVYQLWVLDREREKQVQEEQASLYKSRRQDDDVKMDAEAEEEEFGQLFPEFADVLDERDAAKPAARNAKESNSLLLKPENVLQLYQLHGALFGSSTTQPSSASIFTADRVEVVQRVLDMFYEKLPESLDRSSVAFQLSLLAAHVIDQPPELRPDFYSEANSHETRKAVPIIERLRDRLTQLSDEWPEQMVLLHIRDRCDAILQLELDSPVAKILSALEQLLLHTEDWEGYASSQTTVKDNRAEISSLIVEWRRLELSCWAQLLEAQALRFEETVADWWFRLFELVIRGTQTAHAEGQAAADTHMRNLISLLDQFIRSSTLGHYAARVRLLSTFAGYLDLLVKTAPAEEVVGLNQASTVLANVVAFYSQFNGKVTASLKQKRDVLERDIRNFIKLASWKDINVHALRQSAQKTHRQLHKCIRKFRDVLRQPVDPLLAVAMDGKDKDVVAQGNGVTTLLAPPSKGQFDVSLLAAVCEHNIQYPAPSAPHLVDLVKTLSVLQRMSESHILPSLLHDGSSGLDDLAGEIILRSKALAQKTPAVAKEDNAKAIKNITIRKRKAWIDLLKELKRIGLTSYLKADVVQRQQDAVYVYTQAIPAVQQSTRISLSALEGAERYHYRLLAYLPHLRDSLRSHSPDVPLAELQRGAAFVENAMSLAYAERGRLARLLSTFTQLDAFAARLRMTHQGEGNNRSLAPCTTELPGNIAALANFIGGIVAALEEIETQTSAHIKLSPFGRRGADGFEGAIQDLKGAAGALKGEVAQLCDLLQSTKAPLLFVHESSVLDRCSAFFGHARQILSSYEVSSPALGPLCRPTREWLEGNGSVLEHCQNAMRPQSNPTSSTLALGDQGDRLISSILVIVQTLRKADETVSASGDEDELPDKALPTHIARLHKVQQMLRSETIEAELEQLFALIAALDGHAQDLTALSRCLTRVAPFVDEYVSLLGAHLSASGVWYRTVLKFAYILCTTVTTLATKGFCKPPEEEQGAEADGSGEGEQLEGGTGLGDGSGAQDVTDQMEDDETMEELEKDENEKEKGEKGESKQEKKAREAEEDFGGDLEDIEEDEEGEGEDEGDEQDEQQDLDEHVGDVDPLDPGAVDEKMWDDEDKAEEDGGQDKVDQDQGARGQDGAEEMVAKDEKKSSKKERRPQPEKDQEQAADENGQDNENGAEEAGDEGGEDENGSQDEGETGEEGLEEQEDSEEDVNSGPGRKLNEQPPEAENLDLNDDIDMQDDGEEGKDSGMSDGGEEELGDSPEDGAQEEGQVEQRGQDESAPEGQEQLDKLPDQEDESMPDDQADGEVARNDGIDAADEEEEGSEGELQPDALDEPQAMDAQSNSFNDAAIDLAAASDSLPAGDTTEGATAQQEQTTQGRQGRRVEAPSAVDRSDEGQRGEHDEVEPVPRPEQAAPETLSKGGDSRAERQEGQDDRAADEQAGEQDGADVNPIRSLGDALRDFKKNLDSIQEASERERQSQEAKEDGEGMPETGDVEHVANDDDAEMQALGAANEEQKQKLSDMAIQDEVERTADRPAGEDADDEQYAPEGTREPMQLPQDAQRDQQKNDGEQKALMPSDVQRGAQNVPGDDEEAGLRGEGDADMAHQADAKEDEAMSPIPEDERREADHDIEQHLAEYRSADAEERAARAGDLWRSYASLTSDLAFALCEQLRLILAPTLATRLSGDFRTGKRLNMRKIVPFIASDFAKDKIWLRRTRPSAREYQVLLAVDDSRSMAESRSAHLAYQTLALVSGALGRLEVGDVSICRFGEQVETLHEFGKGTFSDEAGAHVLEKLSFEQRGTNVLQLVESSLDVLQKARDGRPSSSASAGAELWQLEIIISDGVCQVSKRQRFLLGSC